MLRKTIVYYSLFKLSWVIGHIPRKLASYAGYFFGILVYHFIPVRKTVAQKNIQIAFPSLSEAKIREIVKKTYIHFGEVLFEFLRIPFLSKNKMDKILEISPNARTIFDNYSNGIIITGHIGNWEFIPHIFSLNGLQISAVARPQKNIGFDRFISWIRKSNGCNIISSRATSKEMISELKEGFLAMASDQRGNNNGVQVNFFGKTTLSPKGFCLFHLKTGLPVFFTTLMLRENGKYHLEIEELKVDRIKNDLTRTIRKLNQEYHHMLETKIKQFPEQYFWFHRKWR